MPSSPKACPSSSKAYVPYSYTGLSKSSACLLSRDYMPTFVFLLSPCSMFSSTVSSDWLFNFPLSVWLKIFASVVDQVTVVMNIILYFPSLISLLCILASDFLFPPLILRISMNLSKQSARKQPRKKKRKKSTFCLVLETRVSDLSSIQ